MRQPVHVGAERLDPRRSSCRTVVQATCASSVGLHQPLRNSVHSPTRRRRSSPPPSLGQAPCCHVSTLERFSSDIWIALSRFLDLPSIYALIRSSRALHEQLCPLLPVMFRLNSPSPASRRAAAVLAVSTGNPSLAQFVLLNPALPLLQADQDHPLFSAYASASLLEPVATVMFRAFVRAGGPPAAALCPSLLAECQNDDVVLEILRASILQAGLCVRGERPPNSNPRKSDRGVDTLMEVNELARASRELVVALVYAGRIEVAADALTAHPWLASAVAYKQGCKGCVGRHSVLHAAAECGAVKLVQVVMDAVATSEKQWLIGEGCVFSSNDNAIGEGEGETFVQGINDDLLGRKDCDGESALGVAVRSRQSMVAQELVRAGAEVGELVGCTARGGGRLSASQVWFKQALDVD